MALPCLLHRCGVRVHQDPGSVQDYGGGSDPSDAPGLHSIGTMQVEVIDGVDDFVALMQELFNFEQIRDLIRSDFPLAFDAMHAVTGPYANRLFEGLLGAPVGSVRNGTPLEDFGNEHPDPNLTYAHELAELLLEGDAYRFGAACDGDGDRNMILGQRCFVNPSDSLVLTATTVAPAYAEGLAGVARSCPPALRWMWWPRSGVDCFRTPTGWKFFGNLWTPARSPSAGRKLRHRRQPRARKRRALGGAVLAADPGGAPLQRRRDHGRTLEALRTPLLLAARLRGRRQRRRPRSLRPPGVHAAEPGGPTFAGRNSAQRTTSATPTPLTVR